MSYLNCDPIPDDEGGGCGCEESSICTAVDNTHCFSINDKELCEQTCASYKSAGSCMTNPDGVYTPDDPDPDKKDDPNPPNPSPPTPPPSNNSKKSISPIVIIAIIIGVLIVVGIPIMFLTSQGGGGGSNSARVNFGYSRRRYR